jgi:hypothetical protein
MRRDVGVVVLEAEHFGIGARGLRDTVDTEAGDALQPPSHPEIILRAASQCKRCGPGCNGNGRRGRPDTTEGYLDELRLEELEEALAQARQRRQRPALSVLSGPLGRLWRRRELNLRKVSAVKGALRLGRKLPGQQSTDALSAWAWGRVCLRWGP